MHDLIQILLAKARFKSWNLSNIDQTFKSIKNGYARKCKYKLTFKPKNLSTHKTMRILAKHDFHGQNHIKNTKIQQINKE